jgi:hypothetical protein
MKSGLEQAKEYTILGCTLRWFKLVERDKMYCLSLYPDTNSRAVDITEAMFSERYEYGS